jgi:hypothetical protein
LAYSLVSWVLYNTMRSRSRKNCSRSVSQLYVSRICCSRFFPSISMISW